MIYLDYLTVEDGCAVLEAHRYDANANTVRIELHVFETGKVVGREYYDDDPHSDEELNIEQFVSRMPGIPQLIKKRMDGGALFNWLENAVGNTERSIGFEETVFAF